MNSAIAVPVPQYLMLQACYVVSIPCSKRKERDHAQTRYKSMPCCAEGIAELGCFGLE